MKLPYDAVIFDLDGTLTDSAPGISACVRYALQKMNREVPSPEVLQRFMGPPLVDSFMRHCGMSEEDATTATAYYRERYIPIGWKENCVFSHIRRLLSELKQQGCYLAVATGKPETTSINILDYFGLLPYFDQVAGPGPADWHAKKEDLIRRVLPSGKRAVMVGDTVSDIRAGQICGIDTIAVLYGYGDNDDLRNAAPTHIVGDTKSLHILLNPLAAASRGFFVSLEGIDGCGKTTQMKALAERLEQYGYEVVCTREPGGCVLSEQIRGLLLTKQEQRMCPETEALLFAAARIQHVHEKIMPALDESKIVLSDRFVDSSLAYQGEARGIDAAWVRAINQEAMRLCMPGLTLYFRLSAEDAWARIAHREQDRMEEDGQPFQEKVCKAFDQLAAEFPERMAVINANQEPDIITEQAFQILFQKLLQEGVL